ncbi:diguanylate cyclase (GGDEF) domain-containing protein [Ruminococcaceae bacterium YAD3003]|nr:diguanylate cyclase (GGDEF) domain-containing protein [Ruminococcaceae bacterium YAD3003]
MSGSLNLTAILVTDSVGICILLILMFTKGWYMPTRKKESTLLFALMTAALFNCASDAFASICDGTPGPVYRTVLMIGNTYLFLFNLIVGIGILFLIVKHIDQKMPKLLYVFFAVIGIIEVSLLIVNLFTPVVFSLDENNYYKRENLYAIFIIAGLLLIAYGYISYFVSKIRNPALGYFPAWQFLLPILLAVTVQSYVYGISLLPVSFSVAFAGLVTSLQNESIYIDKLTGVSNRYELDKMQKRVLRRKPEKIAALMLDLNGFKQINDNYSHEEGDKALVAFATILVNTMRYEGRIIRFAGDEFVIIIRKFEGDDIEPYKQRILKAVEEYNETSGKPYKLSCAIGGTTFEYIGQDLNTILSKIDTLMYTDKNEYYKTHNSRHGR